MPISQLINRSNMVVSHSIFHLQRQVRYLINIDIDASQAINLTRILLSLAFFTHSLTHSLTHSFTQYF